MKKYLIVALVLLMLVPLCAFAGNDLDEYKYELENVKGAGSSTAGYVVLKVWSYGRREKLTRNKCMRNAVHGLLFKGLDAAETGSAGKVPALVPQGYDSNPKYFDNFFKDDFMQYVQASTKGAQTAGDIVKVSKNEYKIGMVVKVNLSALRKRLEADGIVTGARSLFTR